MTGPELHQRASALFLELRDLPDDERTLRLLSEDDGALRAEVESLLRHDTPDPPHSEEAADAPPLPPGTPSRLGPYTILSRIGQGGSGVVLLAQQTEPIRRRVAIKIVPYAAVDPEFAARFEFERRALERTDHPNIARILDAGRTADGLPYLVMDYVQGTPITDYCRQHSLPLRDRLALMLDVADAVQHAHQRGVIHRDLKPANILVTDAAGRPTPRVLDFGIAKPIAGAFETLAPPTSGLPVGTPAYMAPEQTGGQPIDTRADVYALGAVLYQLVTGKPPIDTRGDPLAALHAIREEIPFAASIARGSDPSAAADPVPRSVLADLDCVLAKALEKSPALRYPTVAALAEDLRRLMRSEPIEARPPTLAYRAARFAQRNRALVASLAAVALAVMLGITGLTAGLVEARVQRREATNQADAQREINRFLTDDLLAAASPDQQSQNVTALELLHRASRRVDQRFPDRPLIAASIHHTLGNAFSELGAFDDAERHAQRAVDLRRQAAGPDAPDTVRSEMVVASLLARRERWPEAAAALSAVIDRARRILGPDDLGLYSAINDLGVVYESMDKGQDAVTVLTEALTERTRLLGPHDPMVLVTTSNLAQAYERLGQTEHALLLQIDALKIADSIDDPPRMTVLGLCNNIGATYQDLRQNRQAEPYLRRASDLAAQWLGPDSPDTLTIQANLAGLEAELGDPLRAMEIYDSLVKASIRVMGPDAQDTLTRRYQYWDSVWHAKRYHEAAAGYTALLPDVVRVLGDEHWLAAQTRTMLGRTLLDSGHAAEALPFAQRATAQFLALYGPNHARTVTATALVTETEARLAAPSTLGTSEPPSSSPPVNPK